MSGSSSGFRGSRGGGGGQPTAIMPNPSIGGYHHTASPGRSRSGGGGSANVHMSPQMQSTPGGRSKGVAGGGVGPMLGGLPVGMSELKPPKKPDKPLSSYMRYNKKVHEQIKAENPNLKMWDVAKLIGQMWRELPEPEKQVLNEEYEVEKSRYNEELKAYYNSPAYQTYLQMKNREKQLNDQAQQSSFERSLVNETRMTITPAIDDEDVDEDGFSMKHIATARYRRNNKLMLDIMSESHVPDTGSIVTASRLKNLRCQVESLLEHENSFIDQLVRLEEVHASRKRRLSQSRERFNAEWDKLSAKRFCWQTMTEPELIEMKAWFKENYNLETSQLPSNESNKSNVSSTEVGAKSASSENSEEKKDNVSVSPEKVETTRPQNSTSAVVPTTNAEPMEAVSTENSNDTTVVQSAVEDGATPTPEMSEPVMGNIASAFKLVLDEDTSSNEVANTELPAASSSVVGSNSGVDDDLMEDEEDDEDLGEDAEREQPSGQEEDSMMGYDENSTDVPQGSEGIGESDSVHSSDMSSDEES